MDKFIHFNKYKCDYCNEYIENDEEYYYINNDERICENCIDDWLDQFKKTADYASDVIGELEAQQDMEEREISLKRIICIEGERMTVAQLKLEDNI